VGQTNRRTPRGRAFRSAWGSTRNDVRTSLEMSIWASSSLVAIGRARRGEILAGRAHWSDGRREGNPRLRGRGAVALVGARRTLGRAATASSELGKESKKRRRCWLDVTVRAKPPEGKVQDETAQEAKPEGIRPRLESLRPVCLGWRWHRRQSCGSRNRRRPPIPKMTCYYQIRSKSNSCYPDSFTTATRVPGKPATK
jgi:hypothetical protein